MKKKIRQLTYLLTLIVLVVVLTNSCKKDEDNAIKDIDGNVYHSVTIGTQTWMLENLKTKHYRNGDPLEDPYSGDYWAALHKGCFCNSMSTAKNAGLLYNYYAVIDSRNIAPIGWHIPTREEVTILIDYLGGAATAGGKLKDTANWTSPNLGANNESKFTAIPAGKRRWDGAFEWDQYTKAFWWTTTPSTYESSYYFLVDNLSAEVELAPGMNTYGFSVRCIKDK